MKNIYIMRHANAQSIKNFSSDKERALSEKGIEELKKISFLTQQSFKNISLVLCSSSVRTRETLWQVLPSLSCVETILYLDILYHADHETVLEEINFYTHKFSNILIVGHNPGVSDFYLRVKENPSPLHLETSFDSLPTSSVVEYTHNCLNKSVKFSDINIKKIILP